jgi:hypothetical protein
MSFGVKRPENRPAKEWRTISAMLRIIKLIDKDKIKKRLPWIEKQSKDNNYKEIFFWCFKQLGGEEKVKIIHWILEQVPHREFHTNNLESYEAKYRKGGHNLAVWQAIDYCHEHNLPLPEWVIGYLSSTAREILKIGKPGKTAPQQVFKAIGIKGKEFSQFHNAGTDLDICRRVEQHIQGGKTVTKARKDAAKEGKEGLPTVRKFHKRLQKEQHYDFMLSLKGVKKS